MKNSNPLRVAHQASSKTRGSSATWLGGRIGRAPFPPHRHLPPRPFIVPRRRVFEIERDEIDLKLVASFLFAASGERRDPLSHLLCRKVPFISLVLRTRIYSDSIKIFSDRGRK